MMKKEEKYGGWKVGKVEVLEEKKKLRNGVGWLKGVVFSKIGIFFLLAHSTVQSKMLVNFFHFCVIHIYNLQKNGNNS